MTAINVTTRPSDVWAVPRLLVRHGLMIFGEDRWAEMLVPERRIRPRSQCGKEALAPGFEVILGNQTEQGLMSRLPLCKRH